MNKNERKLLEMLSYKRKEGSVGQELFNKRFIHPIMGRPDEHGNYVCEVNSDGKLNPITKADTGTQRIAFMAHHDTVHKTDGRQKVFFDPNKQSAFVDGDECLGADCTTGVWLILEMIKAKVPGIYVIHTGEECGGIGARALVADKSKWIEHINFAISFDRYGTHSIITHQSGQRCCSESFSSDLESILNLNLISDSGGTYTDSYEYMDIVSECTNISVGYYNQHTKNEYQDLTYASQLRAALIAADWSNLKPYRDPEVLEYDNLSGYMAQGWTSKNKMQSTYRSRFDDEYYNDATEDQDLETLCLKYYNIEKVIEAFPYEVAEILQEYGYTKRGLLQDILRTHTKLAF